MKNPVAKYINKFNKASTHIDRKKESKKEMTVEDFVAMKVAFDEANVESEGRYCLVGDPEWVEEITKLAVEGTMTWHAPDFEPEFFTEEDE